MKQTLQTLKENGATATNNSPQINTQKKATPKSPTGQFKANRTSVYKVLEEATHEDLREIKSVWIDILDVLDVGQKALMNNSEPVAASPTALVVKFDYDILCERAQEDTLLHETVNSYLDKIIDKKIQLVCITSEEWPKARQDYIDRMNHKEKNKDSKDRKSTRLNSSH